MNIIEVIPKEDYTLYVRMEDGKAGFFNVLPYLESEVFAPLKDKREFQNVRNGKYFVEWSCGADLSADTIQMRWDTITEDAQQGAPADARPSRG